MGQSKGVTVTIIGVVILIAGLWLKDQIIITYKKIVIYPGAEVSVPVITHLDPYGWLLIAIGAAIAILGIGMWTIPERVRGEKLSKGEVKGLRYKARKAKRICEGCGAKDVLLHDSKKGEGIKLVCYNCLKKK